ncbi:hypothetical protein [Dietzia maris]|uniref:hypothetical protein n=1 Tax=Dietzia maris TaxID=37915 RepID=UPI00223B69F2|nr:hypothetical protein [Dietzia maris]MCT1434884.1 hypothetical protein [Dietzia maris]MCT1521512.1 hypothetical protein [Dietzia maris]
MSAQASGNDQMRTYLADTLAAADSPLTVMPQDPQDPWDVRFHDARFDAHMSIRQDRLMGLLDTRSPEAVARGLEYRSAVGEIAIALMEYPDDWYTVDRYRNAEMALYSGLLSVYLHSADMEIDVPIDHINLDRPDLIGPSAKAAIEDRLDRTTGTTADSRWALTYPVGDEIKIGQLPPPAWSPGPVTSTDSPSPANPFTESYLSHRADPTFESRAAKVTEADFSEPPVIET